MSTQKPTGGLWSKFRSSTKSLSSSFNQLTIRAETDGDTPTSTVVHKTLVKFYESQEPFVGFPGWLGHKEELPDEQKILKKQQQHNSKRESTSPFNHFRKTSNDEQLPTKPSFIQKFASTSSSQPPPLERRHTAGMAFHSIYNSGNNVPTTNSNTVDSSDNSKVLKENHGGSPTKYDAPINATKSTPSLMADRLKRQNTRNTRTRLGL